MPYYEPTPEDQKATDIMGYVLGAWLGAILAILIVYFAPQVQNWYSNEQWMAEHSERSCTHHVEWSWSVRYFYSWVTCVE